MQITWDATEFLGELATAVVLLVSWGIARFKSFKIRRQLSQTLDKVAIENDDLLKLAESQGLKSAVKEFERFLKNKSA